jgi:hypothetical protein
MTAAMRIHPIRAHLPDTDVDNAKARKFPHVSSPPLPRLRQRRSPNKFLGNDWCAYSGEARGDLHKRSPVRQNLITQCRDIASSARVEVEHVNFSVRQTSFQI